MLYESIQVAILIETKFHKSEPLPVNERTTERLSRSTSYHLLITLTQIVYVASSTELECASINRIRRHIIRIHGIKSLSIRLFR